MKVGRNDPCPCGSGRKYKKCCAMKDMKLRNTASRPSREDFPVRKIDDYGEPKIDDDFFNENQFEMFSASGILYNTLIRPDLEKAVQAVVKRHLSRGEKEAKRIEATNDPEGLVEIMKNSPDTLNHCLLVEKLLQQQDTTIPMILEELKHTNSDLFVELAVSILHKSSSDHSSELLSLIRLPVKNPYALSQLCVLAGMVGHKDHIKPLWDCYHFFKERYPDKSYDQGPLIGLWELHTRLS